MLVLLLLLLIEARPGGLLQLLSAPHDTMHHAVRHLVQGETTTLL